MTTKQTNAGEEVKSDFDSGVWFQAACSGLWYQNHLAAGSVSNVRVDGVLFTGKPISVLCEHGIDSDDFCMDCNR